MEEMKAAPVVKLDTLSDVNDIGKPWRFEEDGLTVTRLSPWSAPGCHPTGCGLKVYTDGEDRVVKVEGDENHPVTQGRLCVRCLTLMDYMYNPSRIIYPMKRDPEKRGDGKVGFNTPTGRIELYSTIFQQFDDDPLPYYDEPQYSPVNTPELLEEYPYVLTTGARPYAFFHSENRQVPFCRELNPDPIVEVNPKTAQKLGIADGQWCEIWNQFGSCKQKAKVTETVDENTIHCQHAWWFPEEDGSEPNLYGNWRSNVNNLVPNFHFGKLGFGAPFKCLLCNIKPIKECLDTDMNEVWTKFKREDQ